jgi:hypothetical protein
MLLNIPVAAYLIFVGCKLRVEKLEVLIGTVDEFIISFFNFIEA